MAESLLLFGATYLFGLCIGSFLNVCISRIPQDLSIVFPASRCPKCKTPVKPYDNIPVLSWLILGGKCRACHAPISPVYPCVEILTAMSFVGCAWYFGWTLQAAKWAIFMALLIVLFFSDIFFRILPDEVNFFGAVLGLVFSFFVRIEDGTAARLAAKLANASPSPRTASVADAILGATLVAAGLWIFAELFSRIIGRAAMGFGDVKMMAMMGTFLGLKCSFLTLLLGTVVGSLMGLLVILSLYVMGWKRGVARRAHRRGLGSESGLRYALARRYELPLGTFLAIGAAASVFLGGSILKWYATLIQ